VCVPGEPALLRSAWRYPLAVSCLKKLIFDMGLFRA